MRITLFTSLFHIATVVALPTYDVIGQSGSTANGDNFREYSSSQNNEHFSVQDVNYKHHGTSAGKFDNYDKDRHQVSGVNSDHGKYQGSKDRYRDRSEQKYSFRGYSIIQDGCSDHNGHKSSGHKESINSGNENRHGLDTNNEDKEDYDNM
ncbi:hypothetical protein K7432_011108 [Basidiobolus ranarum]|uniref:Uncharacterized protein n=1 Tax=Basidiobolus ranarum TaxID=34480 RepID=A0ABR2VUD9_9FUNG